VGSAGLVYGAGVALGQRRIHEVLAHWRIAQTGLIVIGIFALQDPGLHGALLHAAASSVALAALLILERENDSQAAAGPRAWQYRRAGVTVGFMSAIGVPGLAGFLGQSLLVMQVLRWAWFESELPKIGGPWEWVWRTIVYGGMMLGMGALLRAWRRSIVLIGTQSAQRTAIGLLIVALIIVVGVRPLPVTNVIGPAAYRLLNQVQERIDQDLDQMATCPVDDEASVTCMPHAPPDGDGTESHLSPFLALASAW
jgi:NADH-quinone oxidoreductase subunit M